MNLRIPVKCSDKVEDEDNGEFEISLILPADIAGKDSLLFAGSRELTYKTKDRANAAEIRKGDTLYIALFTGEQKES